MNETEHKNTGLWPDRDDLHGIERFTYRIGGALGVITGTLLVCTVVAVPVAWWLAQVLR